MFKMSLMRTQSGSALLMALLGMTALAGAGYLIAQTMSNSDKVLQHDARIRNYKELVSLVRNNLYAGNNCTLALGRTDPANPGTGTALINSLVPGSVNTGDDVVLPLTINGVAETLQPNWNRNGIKIKTLKLKIDGNARAANVRIHGDPDPKIASYATLVIVPENQSVNILKQDTTGKYAYEDLFIKLFVYYEEIGGNKTIYSCADPASEAAFCTTALGGAYTHDPSVSSDRRCQPDLQCFPHKNGIVPSSSGCPSPYTGTPIGATLQMCNWCHPQARPGGSVLTGFDSIDILDLDFEAADGSPVSCSSAGYGGLNAEDAYEARQDYKANIGYLTPEQYSAHAGCLDYIPPMPPPPTPTPTTGGSPGGTSGGSAGGTAGGTSGGTSGGGTSGGTSGGGGGGSVGGGSGCFIAGTKVTLGDGSKKAIEEIKVGDEVLTYDEAKKKYLVRPVVEVLHHEKAENTLYTFTFDTGKKVTSNDVHLFYTLEQREYLSAQMIYDSWRPGKTISFLNTKGQRVFIKNIKKMSKEVPVYNLHVRGVYDTKEREVNINHNYFADGVLVHNLKQIE